MLRRQKHALSQGTTPFACTREPEPLELFLPKPKVEPEPPEPFSRNRNRNRPSLLNCTETQKNPFAEELPEPKTGTARTLPPSNRNQTEPNRGLPVLSSFFIGRPRTSSQGRTLGVPKGTWLFETFGPAPLQKCVGDFCCIDFGGFCRGFSWRIFLGTFSHKNEEKKSDDKIREKIRRPKNNNPRKIRSAKIRP